MDTPGSRNMGLGLLWFVGGVIVTFVTYHASRGGGIQIVAYGAIIGGAIQFVLGLVQYLRSR